jgi:hypothetical protein
MQAGISPVQLFSSTDTLASESLPPLQLQLPQLAGMLQLPMWSAVDVLPATLGIPGFPGMVLPPPPPMPEPLAQHEQQGQQGAGQRAPRSECDSRRRTLLSLLHVCCPPCPGSLLPLFGC